MAKKYTLKDYTSSAWIARNEPSIRNTLNNLIDGERDIIKTIDCDYLIDDADQMMYFMSGGRRIAMVPIGRREKAFMKKAAEGKPFKASLKLDAYPLTAGDFDLWDNQIAIDCRPIKGQPGDFPRYRYKLMNMHFTLAMC